MARTGTSNRDLSEAEPLRDRLRAAQQIIR